MYIKFILIKLFKKIILALLFTRSSTFYFNASSNSMFNIRERLHTQAPSKGSQELELLKKLAEFTNFCGTGAAVEDCVELLFKKLKVCFAC